MYIERWQLHAGVRAPASHAWPVTPSRTGGPDPALNPAAPPIHTYRLPSAPLSSGLMQGGVKHLGMLNHSRGRGCWEPSGAAREEAGDRDDTPDRPRGQGGGGGQEGVWRQGEGVQVGVKLLLVSVENNNC